MRITSLFLIALMVSSGAAAVENLALEDAAKQLLRDSAKPAIPSEAEQSLDAASGSVEKAKNLKESMDRMPAAIQEQATESAKGAKDAIKAGPADLTKQAVEAAKETGKQQLNQAVPDEAKSTAKSVGEGVDQAKKLKKQAKKAAAGKAAQDAAGQALDMLR